ncbi:RolB family protein [Agrobacterium vitis]|uniref:RolB family protein n=1 Tax=Agrobacterium vitis TaxID=373 RepID=UPI0012E888DE|nr:RolB family protein [Agrobacterium vitis]MVA53130.1 D protein [Agrobacterium vitis]MVA63186.1 D protein [Agrobacterium vitis]
MVYKRPAFRVISLELIRDPREAQFVLIKAAEVYRNFVQQTLADAQKKWVNSLAYHDDPSDAVASILMKFSKYACLHGPRWERLDTIAVDRAPLYIYCSLRRLKEYAKARVVSFYSEIASVVCSMSPFDAGVTPLRLRLGHNLISPGSCLLPDDLEGYVVFFPSKSFRELSYDLFEVHDGYTHMFFGLPPGSRFHFEVVAVGLAFPSGGAKEKRVNSQSPQKSFRLETVSYRFIGNTGTCL